MTIPGTIGRVAGRASPHMLRAVVRATPGGAWRKAGYPRLETAGSCRMCLSYHSCVRQMRLSGQAMWSLCRSLVAPPLGADLRLCVSPACPQGKGVVATLGRSLRAWW